MSPILAPADTVLRRKPNEPLSYQLYDTFEDYLRPNIQERLRHLNQSFPLKSLAAFIPADEITKGQWLLYTQTCLTGQIVNGGLGQFFDNCPGLILDAQELLSEFGPGDLRDSYSQAAQNFLVVIRRYSSINPEMTGDALNPFWSDIDTAWPDDDAALFEKIEAACFAENRDADDANWFTQLERRVLSWILENPNDYVLTS